MSVKNFALGRYTRKEKQPGRDVSGSWQFARRVLANVLIAADLNDLAQGWVAPAEPVKIGY